MGCGDVDRLEAKRATLPTLITQAQRTERGVEVAVGFLPPRRDGSLRAIPPSLRNVSLLKTSSSEEIRALVSNNQVFASHSNGWGLHTDNWRLNGDLLHSSNSEQTYAADEVLDVFLSDGYISRIRTITGGLAGGEIWNFSWEGGQVPVTTVTFSLSADRRQIFAGRRLIYDSPEPLDPEAHITLRSVMLLKASTALIGAEADHLGTWTVTDDVSGPAPHLASFHLRDLDIVNMELTASNDPREATVTADVVLRPEGLPPPSYPRSLNTIYYELDVTGAFGSLVRAIPGNAGVGPEGSLTIEWDGLDRFGNPVAPTSYAYNLRVGLGGPSQSPSGYFNIVSDRASKVVAVGQDLPPRVVGEIDLFPFPISDWTPGQVDEYGEPIPLELYTDINTPNSQDDVSWQVKILDPDGQTLVAQLASGSGHQVYASWDGYDDQGNLVTLPADSLEFVVTGSYCIHVFVPAPTLLEPNANGIGYYRNASGEVIRTQEDGAVEQVCILFDSQETSTTPGVIEVFRGSAATLNANEDGRVAIGFNGPRQGQDPRTGKNYDDEANQTQFLKNVYLYGLGADPQLTIEVSALDFRDAEAQTVSPPDSVWLELEGQRSMLHKNLELTRSGGKFTGSLVLDDTLISPNLSVPRENLPPEAVATKYAYGQRLLADGVDDEFLKLVAQYPPAQQTLGKFLEAALVGTVETQLDEAAATGDNVRSFGFEAVKFRARRRADLVGSVPNEPDYGNPTLASDVTAVLKVRNPAQVVLLNFHGDQDGSLSLSEEVRRIDSAISEQTLTPDPTDPNPAALHLSRDDLAPLETLMLVACSALDAYDFNNWRAKPLDGQWLTRRKKGGFHWDALADASSGGCVLLGYAAPSPVDYKNIIGVLGALETYRLELERLASSQDPKIQGHLEAVAWMSANYKLGRQAPPISAGLDRHRQAYLLQACAWDNGYYYYIPFRYIATNPRGDKNVIDLGPDSLTGVYRIPIAKLSPRATHWKDNIDKQLAEKIETE